MFSSTKSADSFATKKDTILSTFTKTADDLIKLNGEISQFELEQEVKVSKAQAQIETARDQQLKAAAVKLQNQIVADKILAIVS